MNVNDMTREQILEWTNKEGAYELGRQKGYCHGFSQGSKNGGIRGSKDTIKELSLVIKNAQDMLAKWIVPDSKILDSDCLNELLGILDNKILIRLQEKIKDSNKGESGD